MKKVNLNNFGQGLNFNKRKVKKKKVLTEDEMFIETINLFNETWERSNTTYELFQINLLEYEEKFYQIIENCIFLKYGLWKTELIMWYIFGRRDPKGKPLPLIIQANDGSEETVILNSSEELLVLIKKLEIDKNEDSK